MKFAFRADASLDIGTGHVMRCLTLADALRDRGAECQFLCRNHPASMIDAVRGRGYQVHELGDGVASASPSAGPAHARWLGVDWATDARQTIAAIENADVDVLVVDHYSLDAAWERVVRRAVRRIAVVDDLADREHDCDLLLDQNPGRVPQDYARLVAPSSPIYAGPGYALLRPEFAALRSTSLDRRSGQATIGRILITMGGVDRDNVTGQLLNALNACELPPRCELTVLLGANAPALQQVQTLARRMRWPTEVLVGTPHVAAIMAQSDLAIGAMGGTALERCCLGLPTLALVLAANQQAGATALAEVGAVQILTMGVDPASELQGRIGDLSRPDRLRSMVRASAAVTSGSGAAYMAEVLLNGSN